MCLLSFQNISAQVATKYRSAIPTIVPTVILVKRSGPQLSKKSPCWDWRATPSACRRALPAEALMVTDCTKLVTDQLDQWDCTACKHYQHQQRHIKSILAGRKGRMASPLVAKGLIACLLVPTRHETTSMEKSPTDCVPVTL